MLDKFTCASHFFVCGKLSMRKIESQKTLVEFSDLDVGLIPMMERKNKRKLCRKSLRF